MLLTMLAALAFAAPWPTGADDPTPWEQREGGLEVQDVVVGKGDEVTNFALAEVHYTGMLSDGSIFDSSLDRGETFEFRVGAHQVIAGWEQGLLGMKIGGTRRLVIPAELGYGSRSTGPIPPDSVLYFEIQLLGLVPPRAAPVALEEVPAEAWRVIAEGVRVADVVEGTGEKAKAGRRACVDVAIFVDGAKKEDTYARAGCSWLRLGDGLLPAGVEAALDKMRVGGVRQVEVVGAPARDPNTGEVPAGPVVFRVELSNTGK
jgi:FKBP-type peptidyl-prolyl cis-trans isomerase FkpA